MKVKILIKKQEVPTSFIEKTLHMIFFKVIISFFLNFFFCLFHILDSGINFRNA